MSEGYAGIVNGLCGNMDGNPNNDAPPSDYYLAGDNGNNAET